MDNLVDGLHESSPQFLKVFAFRNALVALWVVSMDAIVYNAIKVHVKVVYIGYGWLADEGLMSMGAYRREECLPLV